MRENTIQIRRCESCGLRYPFIEGHPFGIRCPSCAGETRLILNRKLIIELETEHKPSLAPLRNDGKPAKQDITSMVTMTVLLDNIRSAWNVGSILRSADGFGFKHAYLCGITTTPENEAVAKTALGAENTVTWSYHKDAVKLAKGLIKKGWDVYDLEDDKRAKDINEFIQSKRTTSNQVLVVGNEVAGIDPELLDVCNEIYRIPMHGDKRSFNVAIAFGIAAFQLRNGL